MDEIWYWNDVCYVMGIKCREKLVWWKNVKEYKSEYIISKEIYKDMLVPVV